MTGDAAEKEKHERSPLFRLALEAGPLVVFFVCNAKFEIFVATAAFMGAMVVSLIVSKLVEKRLPTMPLVTAGFVLVFGGLTLLLQDDLFIKLKPTVVNVLFATMLLGGLAFGQAYLKPLLGASMQLSDEGWRILTLRWGLFFLVLAALNEVVWRSFSTDAWVSFKVFGIMPLTVVFAISQVGVLKRHELRDEKPASS